MLLIREENPPQTLPFPVPLVDHTPPKEGGKVSSWHIHLQLGFVWSADKEKGVKGC